MSVAPRTVAPSPQATGAVRRSRSELRALTGLRIVAATWVVLFHFEGQLVPYVEQLPGVHAVLSAGWIGVELFFVLSGFVIARSYLDECGRRWSTRSEEHTSELQSRQYLVCRLLLEKKKKSQRPVKLHEHHVA